MIRTNGYFYPTNHDNITLRISEYGRYNAEFNLYIIQTHTNAQTDIRYLVCRVSLRSLFIIKGNMKLTHGDIVYIPLDAVPVYAEKFMLHSDERIYLSLTDLLKNEAIVK